MNDNLFLKVQKAIEVCSSLERYRLVRFSPLKINARCPACGDSEKSRIKARFWVNEKDGDLLVGCFNCNYHSNFVNFCKEYFPDTYKELIFQKFKSEPQKDFDINELGKSKLKITEKSNLELLLNKYSVRIDKLPENHPILMYINSRKIPKEHFCYFYFTKQWQHLVHAHQNESYINPQDENRLIMVIKDFDNRITAIQGRSLAKEPRNKYITIKEHDDANKIFGLDKVDLSKTVFLTEGIVDSLFLDNACAITGGSMNFDEIPIPKDKRVFVWDNEPQASHTVDRIAQAIKAGEKIVLFDEVNWKSKDINDLIIKEQISKEEVNNYRNNNIVQNLFAELRFKNWKKV